MKDYLGDGIYLDYDGFTIWLTTEDGINVTNIIALKPQVYQAMIEAVTRLKK